MTDFENKCYGISEATIREEYMETLTARTCGLEMVVMSILSDAQTVLAANRPEASRKLMNVAKFILTEMMKAKETV